MNFSDKFAVASERQPTPGQRSFTLPAFQKTEFEGDFDAAREKTGLQWDRDVVLNITPIGSRGNTEEAEEFFVKVTFTANAIDGKRSSIMAMHDVMDGFDPRSLALD